MADAAFVLGDFGDDAFGDAAFATPTRVSDAVFRTVTTTYRHHHHHCLLLHYCYYCSYYPYYSSMSANI